jgi:hypothetical protein
MIKHVLIPTDFTVKSLQVVRYALEEAGTARLNILLFHMVDIPHSITDLLFFSKEQLRKKLINQDFKDACAVLRNKYASSVADIQCEIFYGSAAPVFENYVEARDIDVIMYNKSLPLKRIDPRSVEPYALIRKCRKPLIDVSETATQYEGQVDLFTILSGT